MTSTQQGVKITNIKVLIWYRGLSGRSSILIWLKSRLRILKWICQTILLKLHFVFFSHLLTNNTLTLESQRSRCYDYFLLLKTKKAAWMERPSACTKVGRMAYKCTSLLTIHRSTIALMTEAYGYDGLNCALFPNSYVEVVTLMHQDMTLFGDRVFIKLK